MRPLAPQSERLYKRVLTRAFGDPERLQGLKKDVPSWPESSKDLLRNAIRRRAKEAGADAGGILSKIPRSYRQRKQVRIPSEDEASAYEAAAWELPPGRRALALIPLACGLRADELCALFRDEVKRAAKTGELVFMRKGGAEHTLDVKNAQALFQELLSVPRARGQRITPPLESRKMWTHVGEILSPATRACQYRLLHTLISSTAAEAGLSGISPHKLRHAFATRMNRDGASIFTIQYALNHKNVAVTQRYVHPSAQDAAQHMRSFAAPPATPKKRGTK